MKALRLVSPLLLTLAHATCLAAGQLYGEGMGDLYMTFDPTVDPFETPRLAPGLCNHYETDPIEPMQAFTFYLVVRLDFDEIGRSEENDSNGLQAFEARVLIPDEIVITSRTLLPPGSVNVAGGLTDPNDDNLIVGSATRVSAALTPFALVRYEAFLGADHTDLVVSLTGSRPSSFDMPGGPGPVPGWAEWSPTGECGAQACQRPFARWGDCRHELAINYSDAEPCGCRCGVIGCAQAAAPSSWGALKARF